MKKIDKEKLKNKKIGKTAAEFKEFIMRGNVVELAVGVIIGKAFGEIVTSLVQKILMPIIGILIGGFDFSQLSIDVLDAKVMYGSFIQQIVNFLIIAFCIFMFVKVINKITRKNKKEEEKVEEAKSEEVVLLEEIRDLLKKGK